MLFGMTLVCIFLLALRSSRLLHVMSIFFIFLMWLGYCFVKVNLAIGILFILVYISAIAVVLFATLILVGYTVTPYQPIAFNVLLGSAVVLVMLFGSNSHSLELVHFPHSSSGIGMSNIASELLITNSSNLMALTMYYFFVGCLLVNSYNKSLHHKTVSGMRGLSLNPNLELASFRHK